MSLVVEISQSLHVAQAPCDHAEGPCAFVHHAPTGSASLSVTAEGGKDEIARLAQAIHEVVGSSYDG